MCDQYIWKSETVSFVWSFLCLTYVNQPFSRKDRIIHSTSPIVIGIAKFLPMVSGIIGAGLLSTLSLSIFRLTRLRLLRVVLSPVITSLPSFDPISPFTYFLTLPINLFLFPLGWALCSSCQRDPLPQTQPLLCSLVTSSNWPLTLFYKSFGTALKCWGPDHNSFKSHWIGRPSVWTVELIVNKAWCIQFRAARNTWGLDRLAELTDQRKSKAKPLKGADLQHCTGPQAPHTHSFHFLLSFKALVSFFLLFLIVFILSCPLTLGFPAFCFSFPCSDTWVGLSFRHTSLIIDPRSLPDHISLALFRFVLSKGGDVFLSLAIHISGTGGIKKEFLQNWIPWMSNISLTNNQRCAGIPVPDHSQERKPLIPVPVWEWIHFIPFPSSTLLFLLSKHLE